MEKKIMKKWIKTIKKKWKGYERWKEMMKRWKKI